MKKKTKILFLAVLVSGVLSGFNISKSHAAAVCCVGNPCLTTSYDQDTGLCADGSLPVDSSVCTQKCQQSKQTSGNTSATANQSGGATSITFQPPTQSKTIQDLLVAITVALKNLVIPVAILFIVVGGLMYMMSGGSETMIKRARACIGGAIIGLAIVLAGPSFLKQISDLLGWNYGAQLSSQLTIAQIADKILRFLLSIMGIVAIIFLVLGGIMYMTSTGNPKRVETAEKILKYAVLGITVSLASLVIVQQVASLLS